MVWAREFQAMALAERRKIEGHKRLRIRLVLVRQGKKLLDQLVISSVG